VIGNNRPRNGARFDLQIHPRFFTWEDEFLGNGCEESVDYHSKRDVADEIRRSIAKNEEG
jgi:hypothetical protein